MAVRFAQIGDVHIGSPLAPVPGLPSGIRRAELLLAFERAVQAAVQEGAQLIFLPGDLFDSNQVPPQAVRQVIGILEREKDTRFFVIPGNHDLMGEDSVYQLEQWPENVHIFRSHTVEAVELRELGVRVYGRAGLRFGAPEQGLQGVHVAEDGMINFLLLHASMAGESSEGYCAVTPSQLAATGADYVALGHVHSHSGLKQAVGTFYAYSGCLVGRGFDEVGEKGFLLGEAVRGVVRLRFVSSGAARFLWEKVDVSACKTLGDVINLVSQTEQGCPREGMLRISLCGDRPEGLELEAVRRGCLRQQLELRDEMREALDWEGLLSQRSLAGAFARLALQEERAAGQAERAVLARARELGLSALAGRGVVSHDD